MLGERMPYLVRDPPRARVLGVMEAARSDAGIVQPQLSILVAVFSKTGQPKFHPIAGIALEAEVLDVESELLRELDCGLRVVYKPLEVIQLQLFNRVLGPERAKPAQYVVVKSDTGCQLIQ